MNLHSRYMKSKLQAFMFVVITLFEVLDSNVYYGFIHQLRCSISH